MGKTRHFGNEITKGLNELMAEDPKVILLGQDIRDPFGGCFRITKGLSLNFPDRVMNTPISEAGVAGVAVGLAMQGYKPVFEVMFYDFLALCVDQLLNVACKFHEHVQPINITVRAVIGKPGYGFTHCQDLDYLFGHFMKIYHPTLEDDPKEMVKAAINDPRPTIFVEDSKLYIGRLACGSQSMAQEMAGTSSPT